MSLGLFEKSAEGLSAGKSEAGPHRYASCRLVPGSVCRCHAALLFWLLHGSLQEHRQIDNGRRRSQRRGMELTQTRRLGRNDQWLAGCCPLFRPLLTILYAKQRSISDYSTVSLARWTGGVRACCVDACWGSDESSCMLCCTSAHDACVR